MKKTVLSGVQATGSLHLGNYLGAISNWLKMQEDYNCLFFLADLHAITVDQNPADLKHSIISSAAIYLASGIDPKKSIIFPQSMVSAHSELAWIFNCVTPIGWLKRMTQFKDKAANADSASLGLFAYPVLMAADILIYKADLVPTGEDQKQHLELARDIAGVINRKCQNEIFKLPEPLITGVATRIMSLKDGSKKMSKSDAQENSRINLIDSPDVILEKIKKAKTDNIQGVSYEPETRPEIANLINIYSALTGISSEDIIAKYDSGVFSKFKMDLAEIIIDKLNPIRSEYERLMQNTDYLVDILKAGAERAEKIATKTLDEIKTSFGFVV
jgi:tryptophanyl-tRNA synthetase